MYARSRSHIDRCFIVGAPRSGTTLLQLQLAARTSVATFAETHFYEKARMLERVFDERMNQRRATELRSAVEAMLAQAATQHGRTRVSSFYWPRPRRVSAIARHLFKEFDKIALYSGYNGWIEKTPSHVKHIDRMSTDCPSAIFVHIIRDGLPVVASLIEVTRNFPEHWGGAMSVEAAAALWNQSVAQSLRFAGKAAHWLIAYEDLIKKNGRIVSQLASRAFFATEPDTLPRNTTLASTAGAIEPFEEWKTQAAGEIARFRNNRVETILSPSEIAWAYDKLLFGGNFPRSRLTLNNAHNGY